jgi:hypothetical protein
MFGIAENSRAIPSMKEATPRKVSGSSQRGVEANVLS